MRYKQEDFAQAKKWLPEVIAKLDPGWFERQEGELYEYWKREDAAAVCFLIHFADIFGALQNNITEKSVTIFKEKFIELLNKTDKKQFEETVGELQFARILCDYLSPISFEPLAPPTLGKPATRSKCPDYGVRLPGGDLLIEVTTFRFGLLDKWNRSNDRLKQKLESLLTKNKTSCQVAVVSPLEFTSLDLFPNNSIEELALEISLTQSGKKRIPIKTKEVVLEWRPIPLFNMRSQTTRNPGEGEIVSFAFGFQRQLNEEDSKEVFLRSLRNLLDRKKKQSSGSHSYVIAIQIGHPALRVEWVKGALQDRIWPNPTYKWLAGVFIFLPFKGFKEIDPSLSLHYSSNPDSRIPWPTALSEMMEHGIRYHLRAGKYYSE